MKTKVYPLTTAQDIPSPSTKHTITEAPGLRNAWQWLAMVTMLLDHIGYLYDIPALRYIGRLSMPLYAILFVVTIQKNQIHLKRILLLALLAQFPYLYIFQSPQLNIIFGFAIFAWTIQAIRERSRFKIVIGLLMMLIPVSYGWYLYLTMAVFYRLDKKIEQRGAFAVLTAVYVYISGSHWRQLLAICAPFIEGIKAPRPNKYLYRYFYPGHLMILAGLCYFSIGPIFGLDTSYSTDTYNNTEGYYEYYDDPYYDMYIPPVIEDVNELHQ